MAPCGGMCARDRFWTVRLASVDPGPHAKQWNRMHDQVQILVDWPMNLLQGVRLAHAMAETSHKVCLTPENAERIKRLSRCFGAKFSFDTADASPLGAVEIDHATPRTTVGTIARPLIFPHAIIDWCRSHWSSDRPLAYSFCGLLTESRRDLLQTWLRRHGCDASISTSTFGRWLETLKGAAQRSSVSRGLPRFQTDLGVVAIGASNAGRAFPGKSWDEQYYRILLSSRYVLCPNGDYVWSYRFFEAILCGAIPVVEEDSDVFQGFEYARMDEPATLSWSTSRARANFQRCLGQVTVPIPRLQYEVSQLTEAVKHRG